MEQDLLTIDVLFILNNELPLFKQNVLCNLAYYLSIHTISIQTMWNLI